MTGELINKKQKNKELILDISAVNISDGKIEIIDIYNEKKGFSLDEWNFNFSFFVVCCHCGNKFYFDSETCVIYRNNFVCSNCFQEHYGFCNECGELNKYSDMNEDIICEGCKK